VRESSVARNYASTLLSLAQTAGDPTGWGAMIADVSSAVTREPALREFLASPRITVEQKNAVLTKACQDRYPRVFVRFLQVLVSHRRQTMIPAIAAEYRTLLDAVEGRVHAELTLARAVDEAETRSIADQLSRAIGKAVVPHVTIDPAIQGGIIVRYGDTVMDGSVRRRLAVLRARLS
jgi:F-type H+-transporting ATPase subunit delta